ncbi:hypothetical protein E2C01_055726 [Portunus trituberculatus]|uniref:Uncharacterized protein n=1 Tax=Portunus trituberculatus TaxID=210409 RepID=A0A5B7GS21_PORTR|nr:hypothetical protein [Portunus trituberculatus]
MLHEVPSFNTADYLVFTASLVISLGIGEGRVAFEIDRWLCVRVKILPQGRCLRPVLQEDIDSSGSCSFYHWYRSRGRDTKDFLMGGGHMSPIPVSFSFAAGVISAVSILGKEHSHARDYT